MRRMLSIWLPNWPMERRAAHARRAQTPPADEAAPFALTAKGPHGFLLYAVNAAARKAGLAPGLALTAARARMPHLLVASAEEASDAAALDRLAAALLRFSPFIAVDGADGLLLDIAGASHLFGGEAAMLAAIRAFLARHGVTACLGLAPTIGAAHALARFDPAARGPGAMLAPDALAARLGALPIEALRIEPRTALTLRRFGLKTIAALAALPRAATERRFASKAMGERVLLRLDQAYGRREEPLSPIAPPAAAEARLLCAEPIATLPAIEAGLARLTEDLTRTLDGRGEGALALRLVLYRVDGEAIARTVKTALPSREAAHLAGLFKERLEGLDPGFGIELLCLEARETAPLKAAQTSLAEASAAGDAAALGRFIDRVAVRLGPHALVQPALAESHVPERAERAMPAVPASASAAAPALPPVAPRPFRLFARPEPIAVMAEVPDGPPLRFTWRRAAHQVARSRGPERIAGEWWEDPGCDLPIRDYYEVEDTAGRRFWLFRSGHYGEAGRAGPPQWFVHGLYG